MSCPHHGDDSVCDRCPERYATDALGFVHRQLLAGRTALRQCHGCAVLKAAINWSAVDWFRCAECAPGKPAPVLPKPKKRPPKKRATPR